MFIAPPLIKRSGNECASGSFLPVEERFHFLKKEIELIGFGERIPPQTCNKLTKST